MFPRIRVHSNCARYSAISTVSPDLRDTSDAKRITCESAAHGLDKVG